MNSSYIKWKRSNNIKMVILCQSIFQEFQRPILILYSLEFTNKWTENDNDDSIALKVTLPKLPFPRTIRKLKSEARITSFLPML